MDIGAAADQRIAQRLADRADIVLENFKPGALSRYGLDYQSVVTTNPSVIYCSISGFGTGAGADLPGYDLLVQAMGGLMSITGTDEPTKAGVAVVDVLTGLHATVAILAALRHRELTGAGQLVEVSLLSSLLSALVNQASGFVGAGVIPTFMGNAHPSIAPYEVYQTADRPLVIAVGNDSQFSALATAINCPHLATDNRFATNPARVANRSALATELTVALATEGADHWRQVLTAVNVPCGPINDVSQAFTLAAELGLDPIALVEDAANGANQVANPVRYSVTPATYQLSPPLVGQDNASVIAEFDLA